MVDKPRPQDGEPDEISAEEMANRARAASSSGVRPVASGAARPPAQASPVRPTVAPLPQFIAEHTLTAEETLSHLALKYYGHATPPYWKLIYEANKELIGDNPNRVRPGMVLKIPVLPDNMK
jgi:nucleoid-associated protein YgaU